MTAATVAGRAAYMRGESFPTAATVFLIPQDKQLILNRFKRLKAQPGGGGLHLIKTGKDL